MMEYSKTNAPTPQVYKSGYGFVDIGTKKCFDCPRCKLLRHKNNRDCIIKRRNEKQRDQVKV